MPANRTYVTKLLERYHKRSHEIDTGNTPYTDWEQQYIVSAGLGPMAYDVRLNTPESAQEDQIFRSAHLTALIIYRQMRKATTEVLRAANHAGIDVVLLKGISISDELYRPAHYRIMGDIDVLVSEGHSAQLNELLLSSGYRVRSESEGPRTPARHHHLPELRHPDSGVSIEIHTSLVSRTILADKSLNQREVFSAEVRQSMFDGVPCYRFSPEYQIVYTLMHWAIDYKWPVNVISINDIIHLVNRQDVSVEWARIATWMARYSIFADTLTALLLYLEQCNLIDVPAELDDQIRCARKRMGRINLGVLHWLLQTFPMSGRRKVGWFLTRLNARVIWLTLLEPRHKYVRPLVALSRILFRRTKGKSLLGSVPGRIQSLLRPNA
ncbi:MAG: nucleotidyltransferase family protein [Gammaproteobacteria bacterium]|nr:nucleotidyltransferase family protein [Gammaproteobacteria bacterium]MDH4316177.1 nucleotidyltransferase family protein [Gammaproteobacteria bacterium]